jgi:hypothetical protein
MTPAGPPDGGFGFKRLTVENWLTPDPVWQHFVHPPFIDPATAWAQDVLKHDLSPAVPIAVRRLFKVARGALVYGFMFYPLLTLGSEQLFRVLETAVNEKCAALQAPVTAHNFFEKLKWLLENKTLSEAQHRRWDAVRLLRNRASHLQDQNIFDPTAALDMLRCAVELADELFLPEG